MEKVIRKEEVKLPIEQKTESVKKDEFIDLFPDREPIYGGEENIESDPTKLTKNGKDWDPREAGYEVRLMDPDIIKNMGFRGYIPVPKEAGIRFKDHPLTAQGFDGDAGSAVYLNPKDNQHNNDELESISGGRSKYIRLNNMVLCLIPREKAEARRNLANDISNSSLRKDLQQADKQAQDDLGNSKFNGKFMLGGNASRSDVDGKTRSIKKTWSVPAQIK